jgi:hypothetical protein
MNITKLAAYRRFVRANGLGGCSDNATRAAVIRKIGKCAFVRTFCH